MAAQTMPPHEWLIVDNGSLDATGETAGEIAREPPFATTIPSAGPRIARNSRRSDRRGVRRGRGRARPGAGDHRQARRRRSFAEDSFERLVRAFETDLSLGIAEGTCYEQDTVGEWRPTFTTRNHVRGATRPTEPRASRR
jgi:hypothetical protein